MPLSASRLAAIALLLAAGFFAGAQLGKLAPLVGFWHETRGFSLVFIGWLTAAIGLFIAFAALPVGMAVARAGILRAFAAGCTLLAVGALAMALSEAPGAILAARLVEGAGYLLVVIAAPSLLARISPDHVRPAAMGLWGGFVPIGFALADGGARLIPPAGHPQAYLALVALPFAILAGAAMLALFRLPEARERGATHTGPAAAALRQSIAPAYVLLTFAFGFYVVQSLAFFSFLPAWLASGDSAVILPAGLLALFVPGGNVIASVLVAGRSPRFVIFLSAAGFVLGILGAALAFGSVSATVATGAAAMFALGAGMTASSQFAAIPFLIPHGGSPAIAIGFLSQIGGLATLAGPPLAGFTIETWGYGGLGALLAGVSAVGLGLTLPLLRRPD